MDFVLIGSIVLGLTVLAYFLATLGTKERPFEEARVDQRQKRDLDNPQTKIEKQHKKPKVKKVKEKKDHGETTTLGAITETEPTLTPPPSPPEHQPSQKKKDKKKGDEAHRKNPVEEVAVKKTEAVKIQATAPPAGKEVKKEAKKDTKEAKKETKEAPKEAKEDNKETKEINDNKETKELKDNKETKEIKDNMDVKKDTKDDMKEDTMDAVKEVKEDKKDVKKDAKEGKEVRKDTQKPAVQVVVAEVARVEAVEVTVEGQVAPAEKQTATQDKKKKKDKPKNDITSTLSEAKLLPMVQRAPLSDAEIQTMIDVLLNKQQQNSVGGDWVKKGRVDPITQLKRQLEDMENRLRDKDEAHSALSAKITELCSELHGERSKASKLKVQLEDSVTNNSRQQEAAVSSAKAQHASRLNELRKILEEEYQDKLQQQQQLVEQLQNANNENEVAELRTSLSEGEIKAKMLRQEHEELTQHCQQYEEHVRLLEEKRAADEASRSTQLTDLQTQLQKSDAARAQALSELAAIDRERESLNSQIASGSSKVAQLHHNLQEKICEKSEVDSQLIQVESELCSVRQVIVDQITQIERLKEEKESLASQSVRPAAEGQENGDVHSEHPHAPDTVHLQSLVKEKDRLIEEQVLEFDSLSKDISRLKEELKSQREKNDELREKNHTVLEALTITEDNLMARLKQVDEASGMVEEEKTKVRAVLRRIFPEVVVDDALEQSAFLSEFESQALQAATQTAQQPEPQVVEKFVEVIKVVEKVVEVEDPALKSQVEELSKENAQLRNKVEDLEKTTPVASDSQRVSELEDEVMSVTEKVTHYQTVLADTENLLKSLQASVECEEVTWNKRLSKKEQDLKQLVADKGNLLLQVKQLEDTLDKVKKAEDMQEQLEVLKEQLQKEEKEKISLLEELQKAQEQLAQTATQGGGDSEETSILELKAANDKLRALVNVGQDASRQQEELIDQLQKELVATKTVSTNGPASEEQIPEGASASASQ